MPRPHKTRIARVYRNPLDQENASISLVLPILDWGKSKGQRRMAQSNQELAEVQLAQAQNNFERNVRQMVNQFNLQARRLNVARRSDETANRRSEVARRLYILGKSSVLDLNNSVSQKDAARRNYLNALYNYWSYYYTLRSLTLYDFERRCAITTDYDRLIEEER